MIISYDFHDHGELVVDELVQDFFYFSVVEYFDLAFWKYLFNYSLNIIFLWKYRHLTCKT